MINTILERDMVCLADVSLEILGVGGAMPIPGSKGIALWASGVFRVIGSMSPCFLNGLCWCHTGQYETIAMNCVVSNSVHRQPDTSQGLHEGPQRVGNCYEGVCTIHGGVLRRGCRSMTMRSMEGFHSRFFGPYKPLT